MKNSLRPFFLGGLFIFTILLFSDGWMLLQGPTRHLVIFLDQALTGGEFFRSSSSLLTDLFSLFYTMSGGKDFKVSSWLFRLGLSFHILLPYILLSVFQKKDPTLGNFAKRGAWFYTLSLGISCAITFNWLTSNFLPTHTLTWLLVLSHQAIIHTKENSGWFRNLLINVAILTFFAGSFKTFTLLLIFFKAPGRERRMILILALGCFFTETWVLYQQGVELMGVLSYLILLAFYGAAPLLVSYRNYFFQSFHLILLSLFFYLILDQPYFSLGPALGGLSTGFLQMLFFINDPFQEEKSTQDIFQSTMFVAIIFLSMESLLLAPFFRYLEIERLSMNRPKLLRKERLTLSRPAKRYLTPWTLRTLSLSQELMDSHEVRRYLYFENDPRTTDIIDRWGKEYFLNLLKKKNILISPEAAQSL